MKTVTDKSRAHIREEHKSFFHELDNFLLAHLMRVKLAAAAVDGRQRQAWRRKNVNL